MKRKFLIVLMCMLLCMAMCMGAVGETAADLAARFSEGTVEKNGETYRLRKRLASTLVICTETIEDVATPGFMCVLTTEDNEKVISVVYLDTKVVSGEEAGEIVSLSDVFVDALADADAKAAGAKLLEAVNALIGEPLIGDYLVFDIAGLDTIEGLPECDVTGLDSIDSMKARLKNAKNFAEALPSGEATDLIGEMSAYLATEMKSGALIKIADKAERYQINPSVYIEAEPETDAKGREYIRLEDGVLFDTLFDIFYEVNPY